ncbi:hypothetical protein DCC81_01585 [Chitinophaga parva]|uniref:Uncharacterized protein n=1 Tax=Chitinophaga parva TaxID=2169414 RepID=A0A2T7BKN2_9BACT|nr:hypothetical protein DCC81_01585 [Chitinophaga parva]
MIYAEWNLVIHRVWPPCGEAGYWFLWVPAQHFAQLVLESEQEAETVLQEMAVTHKNQAGIPRTWLWHCILDSKRRSICVTVIRHAGPQR